MPKVAFRYQIRHADSNGAICIGGRGSQSRGTGEAMLSMLHVTKLYTGKTCTEFQSIICIFDCALAEENTGEADEVNFQRQFWELYLSFVEINNIFGILRQFWT